MLPPLLFKGHVALAAFKGGPGQVVSDPGAFGLVHESYLVFLFSGKAREIQEQEISQVTQLDLNTNFFSIL